VNYAVEISELKTAKGRRSEHKQRQAEDRAVVGPGWHDSGLVDAA
jgi:hypothetical protein